jgi:hypothetical protein
MSNQQDISNRTIQLGRAIDRSIRTSGRYTITLDIDNPNGNWRAEIRDEFGRLTQRLTLRAHRHNL